MERTRTRAAAETAANKVLLCLMALVLALGCTLGSATSALADESYSITINNATSGTYKVYQIFTGTFADGNTSTMGDALLNSTAQDSVLSALSSTGSEYALDADDYSTATALANAVLEQIAAINSAGLAQSFANYLAAALVDNNVSAAVEVTLEEAGTVSTSVSETGYYLVVQTSTGDNETITNSILLPVSSSGVTRDAKSSTPSATKTAVTDEDTGSALTINEDGSATITYQVSASVASNIADYDKYYFAFVDTLPSAVDPDTESTEDVSWTIYCGTTNLTSEFTAYLNPIYDEDGEIDSYEFVWDCADLTALESVSTSELVSNGLLLTYTVTLSADELAEYLATSSEYDSITNTVYLVFSNNPYSSSNGTSGDDPDPTGTSEETTNTIYFYTLTVYKIDESGNTLDGAAFTLTGANGYSVSNTADGSTFTFTGLEAGVTYTLSETSVPSGYKSIEDMSFYIDEDSGKVVETSDTSGALSATVSVEGYTVTANVTNVTGTSLPFTGAQGIAAGIVIGGALIALSAATLLRRKKVTE